MLSFYNWKTKQDEDLIIANLGDSRAVLGTITNNGVTAIQLTTDLKPSLPCKTSFLSQHYMHWKIVGLGVYTTWYFAMVLVPPRSWSIQVIRHKFSQSFRNCWCDKLWVRQYHFHIGPLFTLPLFAPIVTCQLHSCEFFFLVISLSLPLRTY